MRDRFDPALKRTVLGIAAAAVALVAARPTSAAAPPMHRARTAIADVLDRLSGELSSAAAAVRPVWRCPDCGAKWWREDGDGDGTACPDCAPSGAWCDECAELRPWRVQQDGLSWCEPCARVLGMLGDEDLVDRGGVRA